MSEVEAELVELGYQIFAVAPSKPAKISELQSTKGYKVQILSDSDMSASSAFGLTWRMQDDKVEQYKAYGIDLTEESGFDHQLLPVPAAYLIGADGVIDFAYVNPNHSVRVSAAVLLAVAEALVE